MRRRQHGRQTGGAALIVLVGALFGSAAVARGAEEGAFEAAVTKADIDLQSFATFLNGKSFPMDPNEMLAALGFGPSKGRGWTVGSAREKMESQYVVAFTSAMKIGSIAFTTKTVSILKPDAPYPPDAAKEDQWIALAVPPGQGHVRLVALPPGTVTRAVRFGDSMEYGLSSLGPCRFFKKRLHNIVPTGFAQADDEYVAFGPLGPPGLHLASRVVEGTGDWRNTGEDEQKHFRRAPVSDMAPSWFCVSWDKPQPLVGLYVEDNFQEVKVQSFEGPADISPPAAVESEWMPIKGTAQTLEHGRWVTIPPRPLRAVRLFILKTEHTTGDPGIVARINSMLALTDLGDGPVPPGVAAATHAAPCVIPYSLEQDGQFTMAIDDANGLRVRNLVARVQRAKGDNAESWDLKDEDGKPVGPGTYNWKAITHPPLQLKYEMSVYPNMSVNAPGNTAWLNGMSGPGGWLADHTAPCTVAASGDCVYVGAACSESGVGFAACDTEGVKKWGISWFAAWQGAHRIAADGNTVFVEGGNAFSSEGMDRIWQVDVDQQTYSDAVMHKSDENRKAGATAIATGGGKLYVSVDAKSDWLGNATGAGAVDMDNSIPRQKKMKPTGLKDEPDKQRDFLRLLRLTGTPPGYNGLIYLEPLPGPGRQQHIVVAFNKPVDLGSLVVPIPDLKDMRIKFSLLKPNAPYPPNPDDAGSWTFLADNGRAGWNVIPVPENTSTRALRVTFVKGEDDAMSDALDKKDDGGDLKLDSKKAKGDDSSLGGGKAWTGRLDGLKMLRRRFTGLTPDHVLVNSGAISPDGTWDAKRDKPLSAADPGIYVMEWGKAQAIRGLAIEEIDGKQTEIDAWTGEGQPDMNAQAGWEKVGTYEQKLRYYYQPDQDHNSVAPYMDGYVDFGREVSTRAIRLRVVEQWLWKEPGRAGCYGVRKDRGGETIDATRCRVYGVAAVKYLGGEIPVDPLINERVEAYDVASRKLLKEIHVPHPASIALNSSGDLYAISDARVVKVNFDGGGLSDFISDLLKPTCLAFDAKGNCYAYDGEPNRQVVRVYDAAGKYQRDIGTPGGRVTGPWDGNRLQDVEALSVDKKDHLWVAENNFWPKRVSQWKTDGALLKEFLGPSAYGGGGCLNPWDKTQLFYGTLEFELNWQTGGSRLKNLTWIGDKSWNTESPVEAGELPIKIGDRLYLVNRPQNSMCSHPLSVVYLYEKDHARLVAAMGAANNFAALRTPEVMAHLGTKPLTELHFIWSDRNGDGKVQLDEVTFIDKKLPPVAEFSRDLGAQAGPNRYQVKEFLPSGVPIYELKENAELAKAIDLPRDGTQGNYKLDNGNFFRLGSSPAFPEAAFTPQGQMLWRYPTGGIGVAPITAAKPWYPAQVLAEFGWAGHETAAAGDLGEFVVVNTNVAAWNIWTADGLLAGNLFRDLRDPARKPWTMREHDRGMDLADVSPGQEHFSGYFCRTFADNKYYLVAGHNHVSLAEVVGMDGFKRLGGKVIVDANVLQQAEAFDHDQALRRAQAEVKVVDCYARGRDIVIDGNTEDWDSVPRAQMYTDAFRRMNGIPCQASFAMTYDDQNLYVLFEASDMGPLKNAGNQWDQLFKTGGAVDLQMGLDPNAPGIRSRPVEGDFRLLMTYMNGKPIAVIYRPSVPGAPADKAWEVSSPVSHFKFDEVKILPDVRMACEPNIRGIGYAFEASIPLATLGLKIVPGVRMKLDWGVLATDDNGTVVLSRTYWSNKATAILSDAPSEALLKPDLWGYVRFFGKNAKGFNLTDPDKMMNSDKDKDKKNATDKLKLEDE